MKLRLLFLTFLFSALSWGQKTYTLISSIAEIETGKNYLIVSRNTAGSGFALGYQNSNNRPDASITVVNNAGVMTITTNVASVNTNTTLPYEVLLNQGSTSSYYTFFDSVNSGFLYAASSSSNYLRNHASPANDWTLTFSSGAANLTEITSGVTRNILKYNTTSNLFSCYSSGQSSVYLYKEVPTSFSVIYNGNTNTGGAVPTDGNSYSSGNTVTVLGNTGSLVKTGYAFNGWNTAANGSGTAYTAGSTFTITANTTLYAQWVLTSPPVITSSLTASATTGAAFSYDITATNLPTSYNATGLPAGLSINTSTGQITGSVAVAGTYNVTISATNAYGTDTETLVITITTGPCLSELTFASTPSGWLANNITYSAGEANFAATTGDFTTIAVANPTSLTFDLRRTTNSSAKDLIIEVSTTSQTGPFSTVFTYNLSNTTSGGTTNCTVDLSAFTASSTVFIRFRKASSTTSPWYLTNVNVFCGIPCTPPSDPVGTISGVTPACNSTTLSYSETAVAPVEFYWQTTSLGTSTTNNASSSLAVTTSGDYYVRAFNTATSCWSIAEVGPYAVVISSAAAITSQPANASAVENGGASFTVATTGTGLSYQWQVDTGSGFVNVIDGPQYSGSSTASLSISNATLAMDGYVYQCVVTSACGTITSNSATLTVITAIGTTYNPGELVFVGYDGQVNGSGGGAADEYLIATLVDMIPGTTFTLVNSRFEAGAPANVRTNKWGGGGDFAEEAPYVAELTYNGLTIIPAGSVLRFETNGGGNWFGTVEVTIGTTITDITADFSGSTNPSFSPNISTSGSDQMFLIQGAFTFDGTLDANEANYYLSGTLLHGITNRAAWVPLTYACNGGSSGGNSRESRLPNDLTCFNVENASSNAVSAFYENDKEHGIATIRQIVLALSDVNNNWTLGTGRYTIDPTSSSSTRAGKTFLIGASNPPGQWVGNVNTNWFDCANWEGLAVPKLTTNVVISSSSVRDAQVDYTAQYSDLYSDIAVCNNITVSDRKLIVEGNSNNVLNVYGDLVISATGAVDMDDSNAGTADGTIHLYGDWTNNVDETAFEEGNGTIHFDGTAAQIISNVAPEGTEIFYDVVMNNDFTTSVSNNLIATGDLLVVAGKTVTVNGNDYVQVNHDLTNNGIFNVLDDGSLIQVDDTGVNTGDISYERITTGNNLDYVYWSSPVDGVNTPATGHIYIWDADFANPNGGSGYWLLARNTTMAPGVGYIMRNIFNRTFTGVPRNGVIQPSISRANYTDVSGFPGANGVLITRFDDNWNLVGNPYPSAISAVDFLNVNPNIEGAVRIWTHGTSPAVTTQPVYDSFVYNYTVNDYIVFNATGPQTGPDTFNGFIAGGQSFMINMDDGAAATETVTFNNAMRNRTHNNEQFYRQASPSNKSVTTTEKHRIWLDLANAENNSTRTLVGYITDATNGKDRLFDAVTNAQANEMGIYSIINNERMLIQGRTLPFDNQDKVQLAVNIPSSGTYSIGLSALDGLFNGSQDIYLEDKELNIIHDLRTSPYSFSIASGEFKDRFVLRYTTETLSNEDFNDNNDVLIFSNQTLNVTSNKLNIKAVTVYNVIGQLLENKKLNNTPNFVSSLVKGNQVLIVRVELENGVTVERKVIF